MKHICKLCKTTFYSWSTIQSKCHKCQPKIKQIGKQTIKYEKWLNEICKPFLISKYGYRCTYCGLAEGNLDVHHKITRGSRPKLKMDLYNVVFCCRSCHIKLHN